MAALPKRLATAATAQGKRKAPHWGPYLLLLPSFLVLLAFTVWPMLQSLYTSFFHANLAHKQPVFAGLANYAELAQDPVLGKVLFNNLYFALGTAPVTVFLALLLAVALNRSSKLNTVLRSAFFYPTVLPMVSAATIWLFLYAPQWGLLTRLLRLVGAPAVTWLGDPRWVMPALIIMAIWKETGFFMVFYLAGLQNLPHEVYEAANLDGASPWAAFWKITWPLVMPTTLFVSTIAAINAFKTVDQLYVMTGGGPNDASNLLLFYLYQQAFKFLDRGMAATLTVVLLLILVVMAVFNTQYLDKRIHYD